MAGGFRGSANQFRQFDYGNAVKQGQDIAYNRMRNQAIGQEQQQREDMLRKRKQAEEIRRQMETMPAAIDEMEAQGLYDQADQLRQHYLGQMKRGVDVARMLADSLGPNNYDQVRHDMIQAGAISPDLWPTEYSEDWWAKRVARDKSDLEKLTVRWTDEAGAVVSEDLLARDGDIFWSGGPFESAADRKARLGDTGDAFEYKAADDNAMGNQATRLFGGTYDPATGRFAGLDPEKAQKVQAVHSSASEIYAAAQGRLTHAQAIREAARRLRITIEDPNDTTATDPAGILPQGGRFTPPAPAQ